MLHLCFTQSLNGYYKEGQPKVLSLALDRASITASTTPKALLRPNDTRTTESPLIYIFQLEDSSRHDSGDNHVLLLCYDEGFQEYNITHH